MAYRLELPPAAAVHLVFYVLCLKKKLEQHHRLCPTLPQVNSNGVPHAEPEKVLQQRMKKKWNMVVIECLVKWRGLGHNEASWVEHKKLQMDFPNLKGKVFLQKGNCYGPSLWAKVWLAKSGYGLGESGYVMS